jgi:hypothetical protein
VTIAKAGGDGDVWERYRPKGGWTSLEVEKAANDAGIPPEDRAVFRDCCTRICRSLRQLQFLSEFPERRMPRA